MTAVDVPGLSFVPAANKRYEIEVKAFIYGATGGHLGVHWPTTGVISPSAAMIIAPRTGTAITFRNAVRGSNTAALATTSVSATLEALGTIQAILSVGGSTTGDFSVQFDSNTAAVNVTMVAGSFLRWREIPTS